ncbi:MAG: fructose-6-phosphate aldolase [Crocinitomicaceae bacterium TMED209]|nr:MAG: hypothetical protein CBB97_00640 [Candidatus Endolissoclinum sp. TMED37]RPG88493.1 MAG: fructose-6-phosphate aldolase [Crocinitomicaceae bacterium TMED209]|tara:strand:- start:655 stop:1314 length:660 start_codon:yes stop_codon:yes gene_type:complete
MKIFLDSSDEQKIEYFAKHGFIDGVTTNPSIIASAKKNMQELLKKICETVNGPVSAEVVGLTSQEMIEQGKKLAEIDSRIVVKIPANVEGFKALTKLVSYNIKVNLTVVYTVNQAVLGAKYGATFVSPFVGRLDANGHSEANIIKDIKRSFVNFGFDCELLAASMRNVVYARNALLDGADILTVTPDILELMMTSELSDISIDKFLSDWSSLEKDKRYI